MIDKRFDLTDLRGSMLAGCLALLAGCGGNGSSSSTPVSGGSSSGTNTAMATVPAGLAANPGNAQVSLTWSVSSGATSYHVKRATVSGGPFSQVSAPTSTAYNDPSLTNGTMYYYVVSAVDSAGESADSAQVSALPAAPTPTVTVPAVPAGLAANAGNAQASLTWSASSGATSYHVKRATANGGPYTQVAAPTSNSYTDSSLNNGTTYYYVVSALDSAGESANSAQVSALPAAPAPTVSVPSAPSGVAANSGNALVSLTWSASSGATSYHVKRATTSGGPYSQVSAPTSVTYTDPALTNGTTYYYVVSAVDSAGESANSTQVSARPVAPTTGSTANACGMQLGTSAVIFCDTFDAPAGNGNRSGDLDGNVWGVSRTMGGGVALADLNNGGLYNRWNSTLINKCDGTTPRVNAPNDIIICNGQLREASNDNNTEQFDAGDVTALTMYPKQPFDFTGRTGTVSFDVSNDSYGVHSAWPEFWVSDLPVPAPFSHHQDWYSIPQNGFGVRFAATAPVGSYGLCPNGNNLDKLRWTVDSAVVIRNYVFEDINYAGVDFGTASAVPPTLTNLDCVLSSSGPGQMNHVEVRVSQNQIDVYATDAGVAATPTTLKHIAVITNANLTLTHGLIWLEDAHYNADKGAMGYPTQREHTFSWDNVAFDGPFVYRDFAYDALDNTAPGPNGSFNLGKYALANQTTSWNVSGIPANPQPEAVRVLFNFSMGVGATANPTTLTVIVNGHNHAVPWPYPDNIQSAWRTYAVTIPVTDLVAGTNVVQLGADVGVVYSNVDIVLADVPGGVPVLPGSNNAYPAH